MNDTTHPARRLRHGDRPTEPLTFEDAAANKAAEEGDLPSGWIDEFGNVWPLGAYSPNGKMSFHDAHKRGWKPLYRAPRQIAEKLTCGFCKGTGDGEIGLIGCTDCNGKGYFWEPIEERVAARPVANKAGAEAVAEEVRNAVHAIIGPGFHIRLACLDIASIISKLATPPATTGASTAETIDTPEFRERLRGLGATFSAHGDAYKLLVGYVNRMHASTIAREVAAQAGQVAVPAWASVDERLPGEQGQDSEEVLCFLSGHCALTDFECRDGAGWGIRLGYYDAEKGMFRTGGRPDASVTHWMPLPAAPSPAKESK
jgi:hypothetical protein